MNFQYLRNAGVFRISEPSVFKFGMKFALETRFMEENYSHAVLPAML